MGKPRWALIAESLMASQGVIQKDLQETFGVTTRGGVGHYLTGRREPSIEQIMRLAKRLGVTTSELVGDLPLAQAQDMQEISRLLQAVDKGSQPLLLSLVRAAASQLSKETDEDNQ